MILAAGLGSRLESLFPSKPLATVCDMPLVEISVRQLARAGVTRCVVVTGYRADDVETVLPALERRYGVRCEAVRTQNPVLPNGHSVLSGAAEFAGNYLLVMCDHILSLDILTRLQGTNMPAGADVVLAVDRRIDNSLVDPTDATWVSLSENGMIDLIGKSIAAPHAVDCGAFLASPKLAEAIAEAILAGRSGSLSDGMQVLASRRRAATVEIDGAWWIDVDDPSTHALAEAGAAVHLGSGATLRSLAIEAAETRGS